jgi:copper(I)-binding protein
MPRYLSALAVVAFLLTTSQPGLAHDYVLGPIEIKHPWARATPRTAKTGAGYLILNNGGKTADRLVAATSPRAERVEFHQSTMDGTVSRMRPVQGGLSIAPNDSVAFAPNGYHLMLTELRGPLVDGERVPLTLQFETAGSITVELAVTRQAPAMEHEGH